MIRQSSLAAMLAVLLGFTAPLRAESFAAKPRLPNVLLIVSEDNGPHLGCYGDPNVKTPNLDRLAEEGVRFERVFVTTASCSESRSSILTGLYPHQNGQIGVAEHKYTMCRAYPTMPSLLKRLGYRTGMLGKLHINPASAFPFDFQWNDPEYCSFTKRDVGRIAQVAGRFMAESEQPFFLMVNYPDAHVPFLRQQQGVPAKLVPPDRVRLPSFIGVDTPKLRRAVADYYNCLARLDAGVGMLLEELDRAGLADRTLVMYFSDHGPQFLRGKLTCYEAGLRIPLLLRWPGRIKPGLARGQMVSTVDLLPTVLEAVGADVLCGLPGRSLLPVAQGEDVDWRKFIHAEFHAHYPPLYFPQRTIRDGRYKLIVNLLQDRPNPAAACYVSAKYGWTNLRPSDIKAADARLRRAYATWRDAPPVELYDLKDDPHELDNLADSPDSADIQTRLRNQLADWQRRTNDPLADPAKLAALTREHDSVPANYRSSDAFYWRYPEYFGRATPPASRKREP